jgi:hypothetical protein
METAENLSSIMLMIDRDNFFNIFTKNVIICQDSQKEMNVLSE